MRILYCGNNRVGLEVLQWLVSQGESIAAAVVHPEGNAAYRDEILSVARDGGARIFEAGRLGDPDLLEELSTLEIDVGLSVYFGYILRSSVIKLPAAGFFNVHPALLPYNRGKHPNVWSIVDGTPAGATVHHVDEGVDTGDVVCQKEISVLPDDTARTLYQRLEQACVEVFQQAWPLIRSGRAPRLVQDPSKATMHVASDLAGLDEIDMDATYTGAEIINWLRARTFPPYKPASFVRDGKRVYCRVELTREEDFDGSR